MESERVAGAAGILGVAGSAGTTTPLWWTSADASATGPSAPLPADVALWLTELRHRSDPDDLPWTMRARTAPASPTHVSANGTISEDATEHRTAAVAAVAAAAAAAAAAATVGDSPSGAEVREDAEEGGSSSPDVGANRGDKGAAAAYHCAACQRGVWNPAYSTSDRTSAPASLTGPADPSARPREARCCGPNCPSGRETRPRKLCQNAIGELHSVLLEPDAPRCEVGGAVRPQSCAPADVDAAATPPPSASRCDGDLPYLAREDLAPAGSFASAASAASAAAAGRSYGARRSERNPPSCPKQNSRLPRCATNLSRVNNRESEHRHREVAIPAGLACAGFTSGSSDPKGSQHGGSGSGGSSPGGFANRGASPKQFHPGGFDPGGSDLRKSTSEWYIPSRATSSLSASGGSSPGLVGESVPRGVSVGQLSLQEHCFEGAALEGCSLDRVSNPPLCPLPESNPHEVELQIRLSEHELLQCCEMMCYVNETTSSGQAESEFSLSQLESLIPTVRGMEDAQHCEVETLQKEYHDFYSLCDDTSSLIEETLQYFTEQPSCRVLKTQQSQSTVASSLSDDVFITGESFQEECSTSLKRGLSQSVGCAGSVDANTIFDDGRTVPVAPPRLKKMKRLKLTSSSSSKSMTESCETIALSSKDSMPFERKKEQKRTTEMLLAGDTISRDRKAHSFYSEHKPFSACAGLSTSLQNLALSDSEANIFHRGTESSSQDHVLCESGSNSSLLEVKIPMVKPVSSFVFPSNVESSPPSSPATKHSVRCMSSMEDFTSSMCESLSLERPRKGSGSSDIAAWKRDLQRSGFFSQDDDYMPGEEWFSSTDGKGRVYFFEENSNVSSWTLPNIVVANEEAAAVDSDLQLESSNLPLRHSDGEKKSRIGKARSMFLSDQKHKEATSKSSSIPRNWLQLYGLDKDVLKYGYMNRTKITENGKKMSKKWASAYVVLTEDALCFYKDLKNSQHSVGLQPELSMQLSGARVESGEKLSSRKHIFMITSGSLQLLCECESAEISVQWRSQISNAIARLNRPVITPTIKVSPDKPKTASIGRSKSLQVKNREGTFDDGVSSEEQQMKIRDRLKKFFNRRPTREILASKGIYKDEPVFDSHLGKVCPSHPPFIPEFVKLCVTTIESKDENMKTDGLYRASGNLSHVQKIRLQVDQNNLSVLEAEEDVHVLTGALKLFFRELKEPLIPYELFNEVIDAGGMNGSKKEKTKMFRDIVKKLPPQNHDTLKFLLQHLRRVTSYEEYNRMHVPNIAIVFGPTLMWREKEYHQNMAIEYMQQNLVIEFFLQQFDEIFR